MTNKQAIVDNLKGLQTILGEVIRSIESNDRPAIYDYFTAAKERRDFALEKATKKFDPN